MPYMLEFELPGLPALQVAGSGGGHWRKRHADAKAWKDAVRAVVLSDHYVPDAPLKRAEVTFERHSTREPDVTNLCASFKAIEDGLVEVGVILDDRPSVIGSPTFLWFKAKRGEGKVRIRVREITDG